MLLPFKMDSELFFNHSTRMSSSPFASVLQSPLKPPCTTESLFYATVGCGASEKKSFNTGLRVVPRCHRHKRGFYHFFPSNHPNPYLSSCLPLKSKIRASSSFFKACWLCHSTQDFIQSPTKPAPRYSPHQSISRTCGNPSAVLGAYLRHFPRPFRYVSHV